MVKPGLSSAMAASSLDFKLPSRPAYGMQGRAIALYANYFELKAANKNKDLYRYSLAFRSAEESELKDKKVKKKRVIEILLDMPTFSTLKVASDWTQKLVSAQKIPLAEEGQEYTVEFYHKDRGPLPPPTPNEEARLTEARTRNTYHIRVQAIGTVSLADLLQDLSGPKSTYPLKLEAIDALNTIMAHGPSTALNITAAGNKFFPFGNHPQMESYDLEDGLQAHRGYFTSVRTSVNRLLVNLNVATGAFYKPG